MRFSNVDLIIILVYVIVSTGVGAWIGRAQKNTDDYFLGGRRIPWGAVLFSIVATETSVLTFISVPAISYLGTMTFLQMTLGYMLGRIVIAAVMLPVYFRSELKTAYHYLGDRYGPSMRRLASCVFMGTRLLADGVRLFATAIPLAIILKSGSFFANYPDGQLYALSIIMIGLLTIIYTYIGGIRSVIWMDVVQMAIYVGGALFAVLFIIARLPDGLDTVINSASQDNKFQWIDFGGDLSLAEFIQEPYTFFTALFAGALFSLASHGTDQIIVQRLLSCKNLTAARKAICWSGVAVSLQFLLFLVIGVMLFAYYQGASLEDLGLTRADGIFPKFIVEELPIGVSGLIVAALFAAAMSTLSSSLSSLSSATVLDIYIPIAGKEKSEAQLLKISKMVTLIWGAALVGIALAFIQLTGTVIEVALGIASYTYGGLLGSFFLGLLSKCVRERDGIIGFFCALFGMIVVTQTVNLAWPLYTVVGAVITIGVGLLSSQLNSSGRNLNS